LAWDKKYAYIQYIDREGVKRLHAICCKAHLSADIVQKMIFWMRYVQARNPLGTPKGTILGGAQFF